MRYGIMALLCCWSLQTLAAELVGQVHWGQQVVLSTAVAGVVEKVRVRPGQRVKQGELLLRLRQEPWQASLAAAEAGLKAATLRWEEAGRELQRANELYERGVLSDTELVAAQLAEAQAAAAQKRALAEHARARYLLEHSEIRAPFDGVVLRRAAQPGQVVAVAMQPPPLVVLARWGRLVVSARADAAAVRGLRQGMKAQVYWRGQRHAATIEYLGLAGNASDQYDIRAEFRYPAQPEAGDEARLILP